MSELGIAVVCEMLERRSKSRLNSLRHCVERCVSSTLLPGRNLSRGACRRPSGDVRVLLLVAAVAEFGPHAVTRGGERARAGRARGLCCAGPARRLERLLREPALFCVAALSIQVGERRGTAEPAASSAPPLTRPRSRCPASGLGTLTLTRKLFVPCAATSTQPRPMLPRRITRRLTSAFAARLVSSATTPLSVPALAPAGSELIDVTAYPGGVRGGCRGRQRHTDAPTARVKPPHALPPRSSREGH